MSGPAQGDLRSRVETHSSVPLWRNIHVLQAATQIAAALLIVGLIGFLLNNLFVNAEKRGVDLGFGFLSLRASIKISNAAIPYSPDNSYFYAFLVGVVHTLRATLLGIVLATILGVLVGVARLSHNWLVQKIFAVYIGAIRNIPLIVTCYFFYFGLVLRMPITKEAIRLPGPIFLSNRGVYTIWGEPTASFGTWLLIVLAALIAGYFVRRWLKGREKRTGTPSYPNLAAFGLLAVVGALGWLVLAGGGGEPPLTPSVPFLKGTNFRGGLRMTPEYFALVACLTVYIATYIGEIVRGAIQSIPRGQLEAARAVGLSEVHVLRYIVIPQALRIIVPPTIGQYINLTKGSSLAIVVGYADIYVITRNIIEQSGSSAPMFLLIIATYLVIAGVYSLIGNLYNRSVQIVER
ncbi:MAG: ABC transporter permease subunit [Spirochaetaceae bacterium]|nr:ABC transporter permease subunit [Spirochaetaceae bacterium]